jgi:hypothetical protein
MYAPEAALLSMLCCVATKIGLGIIGTIGKMLQHNDTSPCAYTMAVNDWVFEVIVVVAGPNQDLYLYGGLYQAMLLIHMSSLDPSRDPDGPKDFLVGMLTYSESYTVTGLGIVIRVESFSTDRSQVTISVCRQSWFEDCKSLPPTLYAGPGKVASFPRC